MNYGKSLLVCLVLCMFIQESNTWGIIDSITSNMKTAADKVKSVAQSALGVMKSGFQSAKGNVTSGAESAWNRTKSVYYGSKDWGKALLRNTRNVQGQSTEGGKKKVFKMVDIRNVASKKIGGRRMVDMRRQKPKKKARKSSTRQNIATTTSGSV